MKPQGRYFGLRNGGTTGSDNFPVSASLPVDACGVMHFQDRHRREQDASSNRKRFRLSVVSVPLILKVMSSILADILIQ